MPAWQAESLLHETRTVYGRGFDQSRDHKGAVAYFPAGYPWSSGPTALEKL
jgi:hypothetical protein